ncbi:MAG TPA: J domain-containing protein [Afifellaceae bacterium]|nr:J domain-containing protein [Afifellaceae bacterium]
MLDRGAMNDSQKIRLAVEMTLEDGKITRGRLVGKFRSLGENLAGDGAFLELEAGDGRQTFVSKRAIRKISEISMPVADHLNRKMAAAKVGEAYTILGVSPRASEDELMAAYRELCKVYHPDRMASMDLPAEMLDYAEAMQRRINAAFDELRGGAKTRDPQPATTQPSAEKPAQPRPSAPPRQAAQPQPAPQQSAQARPNMTFTKSSGPRWATEAA